LSKPDHIELTTGEKIPILYEDRSVLAIDKPPGWMLVPFSWQKTSRNLQAALVSSIKSGAFWAKSRQLRFLRYAHRLDADTSGVMLLGKSPGAVEALGKVFETRQMQKLYLAVVTGVPKRNEWVCRTSIGPDPQRRGCMRLDRRGKSAETEFKVLQSANGKTLLLCRPHTGRTHQIRVHLLEEKLPILGDELYGGAQSKNGLGLRAVGLRYTDPFLRKLVTIRAPFEDFVRRHGFESAGIGPETLG
jgi:23S rRNA pseudouridine1911/1915/1917 synthase